MAAAKRGTIRTSGGADLVYEMHGEMHGAGRPIVFVAGLGDDRTSWAAQIPEFARDHLVVAFDNRGIGESSAPPGPYTTEQMADDAHDVVRHLGLDPVVAVGSSMGGAICQQWALRHPADIDRLVITNSWAEQDPFVAALIGHWISLAENNQPRHLVESLLLFCHCPDYLIRKPETVATFLATPAPRLQGIVDAGHACLKHHTLERAHEIAQPALIVAGEHDILTRPELSQRLAARMPNARYESLPTSHMVFWEMPDEFNALLRAFARE
jgi:pimeloyl-ACP methyl ester carboxylesterase